MTRKSDPKQSVKDAVYGRDGMACALCSRTDCGGRLAIHHRLPRGRGGDNRLSNLLLLGDFGGCHDLIVESKRTHATDVGGWLVRTGHDPATAPVIWHGRKVFLRDDGTVKDVCDPLSDDGCTDQTPCADCPRAAS